MVCVVKLRKESSSKIFSKGKKCPDTGSLKSSLDRTLLVTQQNVKYTEILSHLSPKTRGAIEITSKNYCKWSVLQALNLLTEVFTKLKLNIHLSPLDKHLT